MNSGYVTTPFGRRPMTLAMVANHVAGNAPACEQSIDKWALYRALCQAKPLLGLSDRSLALLNALLSFYPKAELSDADGLIVFPSNQALSLRTHGMAEQTIRRHLASLVDAGLLLRKDSPNGKRYARRGRAGEVRQAFGFSLAPLLRRAGEIAQLAEKVETDRHQCHLLREEITLHRRDIAKMLAVATSEQIPGDWQAVRDHVDGLAASMPRKPDQQQLEAQLAILSRAHAEIVNALKKFAVSEKVGGRTTQNERHIESKPESRFDSKYILADAVGGSHGAPKLEAKPAFTAALVNQACPNVATLVPDGTIRTASDLIRVQPLLCSMLAINRQLLDFAIARIGVLQTAATIACLYEKGEEIASASGYLRNLARSAEAGAFSVRPMLDRLAEKVRDPSGARSTQAEPETSRPCSTRANQPLLTRPKGIPGSTHLQQPAVLSEPAMPQTAAFGTPLAVSSALTRRWSSGRVWPCG